MNILNRNQPIIAFTFLLFVVLFSFLFPLYTNHAEATDSSRPVFSNIFPSSGSFISTSSLTVSGKVSDDVSLPGLITVEVFDSNSARIQTLTPFETGDWTFTIDNLTSGSYTYSLVATDEAGKSTTEVVTYTIDLSRPFVLPSLFPEMDMTHVPINTQITFKLSDDNPIPILKVPDPVSVYSETNTIIGTANYDSSTQTVTFTPAIDLTAKTKYFVKINNEITDQAGKPVFPKSWSFTTSGDPNAEDPHGNYTNNVNTCANCHGTHVSKGPKLEEPRYTPPPTENYCMACHDGTVAPKVENGDKTHKHNFQVNANLEVQAGSCTSCHNPHLTWTNVNPNLMKDHYVYDHALSNNTTRDSSIDLCEKCHGSDTRQKKDFPGVNYNVFQYRKSTTASGLKGDFSLCLRCHDGNKASNIQQYFEDTSVSGHRITALDGSPLSGQIPCADCHDTHGSNNIKVLKEKLGHENQTDFSDSIGDWDALKERNFCTKCHNGSTAVYGVIARFTDTVQGHEATSADSCSKCHGGESQSFLEAAHAPKQAVKPVETQQAPAAGEIIDPASGPVSATETTTTTESSKETVAEP